MRGIGIEERRLGARNCGKESRGLENKEGEWEVGIGRTVGDQEFRSGIGASEMKDGSFIRHRTQRWKGRGTWFAGGKDFCVRVGSM